MPKTAVATMLDAAMLARLDAYCTHEHRSRSQVLTLALEAYLDAHAEKKEESLCGIPPC